MNRSFFARAVCVAAVVLYGLPFPGLGQSAPQAQNAPSQQAAPQPQYAAAKPPTPPAPPAGSDASLLSNQPTAPVGNFDSRWGNLK